MKRHIHFDVYGTAGGIDPAQESNGASMLAAADLGKQIDVRRQGHAHQLAWIFTIELQLENSASRHFRFALGILPREPEELRDAVAQRSDQREPRAELRRAHLGGA